MYASHSPIILEQIACMHTHSHTILASKRKLHVCAAKVPSSLLVKADFCRCCCASKKGRITSCVPFYFSWPCIALSLFANDHIFDCQRRIFLCVRVFVFRYAQLREEAGDGGALLVDALCESSGISQRGDGERPYPPRSLRNMYRLLVKGRAAAQHQHYGLFLYFLRDVDEHLGSTFAAHFAAEFDIPTAVRVQRNLCQHACCCCW
jgi:hypothetical protein